MEPLKLMELSNPAIEIGCAALAACYIVSGRMTGRRLRRDQLAALISAMALLILTLDGPLEKLEEARLFTAHMVQHLSLALVIPPLLLLATPEWLVNPLLSVGAAKKAVSFLTYPLVAYLLYNLTLVGLHSPAIYDWMCRVEAVHVGFHFLLLGTAVLLWWPLLSPTPELPRLSYPAQMLYLFAWLLPMAAVAAPITMAQDIVYAWYRAGAHPFGLSARSDQMLGGLTMWVGAGFYLIGIFTSIFFIWARRADLDEPEFNLRASKRRSEPAWADWR